ncbi:hypothetical protein [Psychromonas sp. SA13A]|uniref:hypothetical protein n=1 Tax=Psychromonas sp. SA13A TaxID=2686346 RepID=UPI001407F20B|nr:hypothetical protein [Psychromonas sp. SA13A]
MKKLYIHIGLSKTGSSAIQSWLSLNSEELKRQGGDYADLSPSAKEGKITAGNGVQLFHACNSENWEEVERLILNVYFGNNFKAIISSETLQNISPIAIKKIKSICDDKNIEVNIIAYVRSVYELLYSNYLQGVKRHGFTFRFGEKEGMGYKPQRTFLENYFRVFGSDLKVLNYDSFKKDIYRSFASVLELNVDKFIVKNRRVNRSLIFGETEVLIEMNQLHKGVFSTEISDFLIELSPELPTTVFYKTDLLEKTRKHAIDDLNWINEHLIHDGDLIELDFSNKFQSVKHLDDIDNSKIFRDVATWALNRETQTYCKELVDFLRDFAVFFEKIDVEQSYKLMKKALLLRPQGPFIQKKVKYYERLLAAK